MSKFSGYSIFEGFMCEIIQDLDDGVCGKIVEYCINGELDPEWYAPPELNRTRDPVMYPENGDINIDAPVIKVKTLLSQTNFANRVTKFIKDVEKLTQKDIFETTLLREEIPAIISQTP